jgi:mono/diheme cytochrome c family protein
MRYLSALVPAMAIFLIHAGTAHAQVSVPLTAHPGGQYVLTPPMKVARGKYLAQLGGCSHCHTPGYFSGKADMTRELGGSDVGFDAPGLGVFVGPNLTPDNDTGLGAWTQQQIVTAIRTGVRPDGRILAPVMPWSSFATLTDADAYNIAEFLKSLPPVAHKVPGPFGPNEKVPVPHMTILPPAVEAAKP